MKSEFIQGLCSAISPVHRRVLNASSEIKKSAMSVYNTELPTDIAIMIATNAIPSQCESIYGEIFEIWMLLNLLNASRYVRHNENGKVRFSMKKDVQNGVRSPSIVSPIPRDFMWRLTELIIASPM